MISSYPYLSKSRNLDCLRQGSITGESCTQSSGELGGDISHKTVMYWTAGSAAHSYKAPTRQQVAHPNSSPAATSGLGAEHRAFFIRDRHAKNFARMATCIATCNPGAYV